jgi:hypothetical protein
MCIIRQVPLFSIQPYLHVNGKMFLVPIKHNGLRWMRRSYASTITTSALDSLVSVTILPLYPLQVILGFVAQDAALVPGSMWTTHRTYR